MLSDVMRIWSGQASQTANSSRAGSPEADPGFHLVELEDDVIERSLQSNQREIKEAFKDYLRKPPEGVPDKIVMKGYQMLGINWLNLLHSRGLSCILADEMGTNTMYNERSGS